MDKNVDHGSAIECTGAHIRLTRSPKEEEKSLYVFFCIGASFSISREILCLPYAGFFKDFLVKEPFIKHSFLLIFSLQNMQFSAAQCSADQESIRSQL
jgi:hypothetical protein